MDGPVRIHARVRGHECPVRAPEEISLKIDLVVQGSTLAEAAHEDARSRDARGTVVEMVHSIGLVHVRISAPEASIIVSVQIVPVALIWIIVAEDADVLTNVAKDAEVRTLKTEEAEGPDEPYRGNNPMVYECWNSVLCKTANDGTFIGRIKDLFSLGVKIIATRRLRCVLTQYPFP